MTTHQKRGPEFGAYLGRLTRDAREARRLEEERKAKERREADVRRMGEAFVDRCCQKAEEAARDGRDLVNVTLADFDDNHFDKDVGDYVLIQLHTIPGIRADLDDNVMSICWEELPPDPVPTSVPAVVQTSHAAPFPERHDDPEAEAQSFAVQTTPVLSRVLVAEGTRLMEKQPCEKCAARHSGPDAVDEVSCFCECHILSGPHPAPGAP